jgi:hypothetical protein
MTNDPSSVAAGSLLGVILWHDLGPWALRGAGYCGGWTKSEGMTKLKVRNQENCYAEEPRKFAKGAEAATILRFLCLFAAISLPWIAPNRVQFGIRISGFFRISSFGIRHLPSRSGTQFQLLQRQAAY